MNFLGIGLLPFSHCFLVIECSLPNNLLDLKDQNIKILITYYYRK